MLVGVLAGPFLGLLLWLGLAWLIVLVWLVCQWMFAPLVGGCTARGPHATGR